MREVLIEGLDTHGADALCNQVADGVIDHGGSDARAEAEAIGHIGGDVKLTAADMYVAMRGLAEGNDSWVQTVHQGAEGHQVQRASRRNLERQTHTTS